MNDLPPSAPAFAVSTPRAGSSTVSDRPAGREPAPPAPMPIAPAKVPRAAASLLPMALRSLPASALRSLLPAALCLALAAPFTLAYYGKERMNYFSHQEVAATRWVYGTAPKGSLLAGVTSDFPWAFVHYEWYDYAWLKYLTPKERRTLDTDPAQSVANLLRAGHHPHAYFVLTRSEEVEVRYTGEIPAEDVPRLEAALRHSAAFRIAYENRDATIFELVSPRPAPGGRR